METEIWKVVERCHKVEVSNMGRMRYARNKRLCTLSTHCNSPACNVRYNGGCVRLHVAQEVWRAFGTGKATPHTHVLHRDKDNFNCHIDNLYVVMDSNTKVQDWQLELYHKSARRIILCELKKRGITNRYYGYDVDNIIGEALYIGWKYLPTIKRNTFTSLYYLMKKCVTWAIATEFRNGKEIRTAEWETYHSLQKNQELY